MEPAAPFSAEPNPLDYAQSSAPHRRRVRWQMAGIVALCLMARWSAGPIALVWRSARIHYEVRQCLAHPITPGVLVYSSGPPVVAPGSTEFSRLAGESQAQTLVPCGNTNSVIYLGTRRASNGLTRFIAVSGVATLSPSQQADVRFPGLNLSTATMARVSERECFNLPGVSVGVSRLSPHWPQGILIYSAIEDPLDASRFTFTFDAWYVHGVMDCRLQPDGSLSATLQEFEHWGYESTGARSGILTRTPGSPLVYSTPAPN